MNRFGDVVGIAKLTEDDYVNNACLCLLVSYQADVSARVSFVGNTHWLYFVNLTPLVVIGFLRIMSFFALT